MNLLRRLLPRRAHADAEEEARFLKRVRELV